MSDGLRARKRRDAMQRIQQVALRLFDQHAFAAVTVEQIAEEAGVSAMTVYRHFGTKENIVLHDDLSAGLVAATEPLLEEGLGLRAAVERVLRDLPDAHGVEQTARQRIRLVTEVPSIAGQAHIRARAAATALAARLVAAGAGALEARVDALAVLAALEAASDHWYHGGDASLVETSLAALAALG